MYQLLKKRWGLTPDGKPVRLESYICDSAEDELPTDVPIGSDCITGNGAKSVYFGGQTGWVTLQEGGSSGGGESSGAAIDDGAVSSGSCWSSQKVNGLLQGKANVNGKYPGLTVGEARTLTNGAARSRTFTAQSAGGEQSIGSGGAQIRTVYGNTLYFRQLIDVGGTSKTENGVTITNNRDGTVTVNTDAGGATAEVTYNGSSYSRISGHKYLCKGCPLGGSATTYSIGSDYGYGYIVTATSTASAGFTIYVRNGCVITTPIVFRPQVFDLTEIFGEGSEPTAEEFNALFPESYYAYSAKPVTLHFRGTAYKTVGFNAFDGTKARVIKSFDGVGQNHGYELNGRYTAVEFARTVNGARETLTPESYTTEKGDTVTRILTPDAGYVFISGSGDDTCLHLIWSGNMSGENYVFEAHGEDSAPLPTATVFPDGMKSVGSARDELTKNTAVRRVESVALTDMTWVRTASTVYSTDYFLNGDGSASAKMIKLPSSGKANMKTAFIDTAATANDVGISIKPSGDSNAGRIVVRKASGQGYDSLDAFIASIEGCDLTYELNAPQETTLSPAADLSAVVSEMGVEEIAYDGATSPAVVSIAYGLNVQDVIARLGIDYISKESFDDFCAALGGALGITVSASYSASAGRYIFTITQATRQNSEEEKSEEKPAEEETEEVPEEQTPETQPAGEER